MRMNRPRTPPATIPDFTGPPVVASPWRWSAAEPEPSGHLLLPGAARRVLGAEAAGVHPVSGVVRGDTLVLRPNEVNGRSMTVDGRGRVYLPVWLRRHPGFLIGTHATAGYPVAQAFAGHAPPSVTGRYLHASLAEVATAVAALTGEDHPLAHPGRDNVRRSCADPRR